VLGKMKKPGIQSYERFAGAFCKASDEAGKEQYLVPYFITGHPGSTLKDTIELALYLKQNDMRPRQIQDFIPTPMAVATAMYYTGLDPLTGDRVEVARDLRDKRMMKALLYWWDPVHWPLAREALARAGRRDLVGNGPRALVPPEGAERGARGEWYKSTRDGKRPEPTTRGRARNGEGRRKRGERGDAAGEGAASPRPRRRVR
jgi:hypothetical protein